MPSLGPAFNRGAMRIAAEPVFVMPEAADHGSCRNLTDHDQATGMRVEKELQHSWDPPE